MSNVPATAAPAAPAPAVAAPPSLISRLATRFSVEPSKMLVTLKATAFRQPKDRDGHVIEVTNEQMMALLVIADQYGLNPWTKEIYAFADKGAIVPVVGVDGWLRIINSHPQFDGIEWEQGPTDRAGVPEWIEATIYRKDRSHPTRVREYLAECRRDTGPWRSHPRRMLRHKATIQCGRVAFGFVGLYDLDEAERMLDGRREPVVRHGGDAVAAMNRRISHRAARAAPQEAEDARTIDAAQTETAGAGEPPAAPIDDYAPPETASDGAGAPSTDDDAPVRKTYAEVRDAIEKSKTLDELELAGQLIELAPPELQTELGNVFAKRRKTLASA